LRKRLKQLTKDNKVITLAQATQLLAQDLGFNAGNLRGYLNGNTFEVFSYSTLIATRNGQDIWITDQKYSQTTSKHTNIVARAWGLK
jgi:hypothetical protein